MTPRARRLATLTLTLCGALSGNRAGAEGGWVVRVPVDSFDRAPDLAASGDLWGVYPRAGFAVLEVDAAGFARLLALGLTPQLDFAATTELAKAAARISTHRSDGDTIAGFPCYRTVESTLARGAALAAAHPDLASWIDIGDSWEKSAFPGTGYDLRVLRLTGPGSASAKPVLFVSGGLHPREYASTELATRFAEGLVEGYGREADTTALVDHNEIHILFQANPDGRKRAEAGLSWRKNTNNLYCGDTNDRGADLNRNFGFQWGCCGGGSDDSCSPIFRGPGPGSEPEIAAIEGHLRTIFPDQRPDDLVTPAPETASGLVIDLHSPGEMVLSPWGFTSTAPPNGPAILALARKLAYPGQYFPRLGSLGVVDGASKDFAYGELGVPAYTLELGLRFFEPCPFFEHLIVPRQLEALEAAARLARRPYLETFGPEAHGVSLEPPRPIAAGTPLVTLQATVDDTRFAATNGVEPSESIVEAEVCVDLAPWEPGAVCSPLAAADGAFDEPVEIVTGTVPTGSLAPGRHTLFVRGADAAGNWGAAAAAFLTVLDETAGKLVLRLLDGDTLAPLAGSMTIDTFVANAELDGLARLELPGGLYQVTARAPGHAPVVLEVDLPPHGEFQQEVHLSPFATAFADDGETPAPWSADPPWALTTESAANGTHSWTDSPGGPYAPGVDAALTSPALDLSAAVVVSLEFQHRFDLVQSFDLAQVETSIDGGASWQTVAIFTGEGQTTWRGHQLDLPGLAGIAAARLRFRLTALALNPRDGWYLDDLVLRIARRPAFLFADGFETGDVRAWSSAFGH